MSYVVDCTSNSVVRKKMSTHDADRKMANHTLKCAALLPLCISRQSKNSSIPTTPKIPRAARSVGERLATAKQIEPCERETMDSPGRPSAHEAVNKKKCVPKEGEHGMPVRHIAHIFCG